MQGTTPIVKEEQTDETSTFHQCTISMMMSLDKFRPIRQSRQKLSTTSPVITVPLYIVPAPRTTFLDTTFTSLVLRHERTLLKKQTLTAWMATLGGGYFFIKQLSKSLQLARQQRLLALQIGNEAMARHCLLNEAYNLIYAGKFDEARRVLTTLEKFVVSKRNILEEDEIQRTLRQCHAARLFCRRLKKLSRRLGKYHTGNASENHTMDDFQRVRIVQEQ
mmetsp:Transcript_21441/g.34512  ORF Transcript_21441/g.34512 Transcript_21441/m.34512 type:complete len:220 (+) Transcript_21441:1-660(+)